VLQQSHPAVLADAIPGSPSTGSGEGRISVRQFLPRTIRFERPFEQSKRCRKGFTQESYRPRQRIVHPRQVSPVTGALASAQWTQRVESQAQTVAANASTPVSSAENLHSRAACPGSVA
jgi:hypothetical protein